MHFAGIAGQAQDNAQQPEFDVLQAQVEFMNQQIQEKDEQQKSLQTQLTQKDAQIDQLHQLVAMAQSNQADTLKQLEDSKA